MTRVLFTADLHLGKGSGYSDDRLAEQEAVWAETLALAERHECEAILHGGDVFEGPLPTPEQYQAFTRPVGRCPVPLVAVSGNGKHDAAMRASSALDVVSLEVQLSRRPELIPLHGLVVATLPWTSPGRLVAAQDGGDRDDVNAMAAAMLIDAAGDLRVEARERFPDLPCVLLGHWATTGWRTPTGHDTGDFREPVLPLGEIERLGFDAALFGHVHLGGRISESPLVLSAGSPMPLDFGEAGCDHGVWLLDVAPGRAEATFVPIESRAFLTIEYALAGLIDDPPVEELPERAAEIVARVPTAGTDLAPVFKVKLNVTPEQARRIDQAALKRAILAAGASRAYVEQTVVREARSRVEGLDEHVGDGQALELWLSANPEHDERADALRVRHAAYSEALG